jgi:hypothetical protein
VAIAVTELDSGIDNTDQQIYTTGSFTLDQNELILVGVVGGRVFGTPGTVTVTGHSLTWAEVQTTVWGAFASTRFSLLRAMKGTAGTSTGLADDHVQRHQQHRVFLDRGQGHGSRDRFQWGDRHRPVGRGCRLDR